METTRRTFLGGLAAASVPAGAGVAAAAIPTAGTHVRQENPDLVAAYATFKAAQAELVAAKDALEWLADEWKHLWPLAPEGLLEGANAHNRASYIEGPPTECDILGRPLMRETAGLTKRLTPAQRRDCATTCFTLQTESNARKRLASWQAHIPKGRTEKSLAKAHATKARFISQLTRQVELAREYEAETARVRAASGVEAMQEQVLAAEARRRAACAAISRFPAYTCQGLRIKAESLLFTGCDLFDAQCLQDGFMGDICRFIKATVSVTGGPLA